MNVDTRMEEARRRLELRPPVRLENEGQLNDDPNFRSDYPRMMYRATEHEEIEMLSGADGFPDDKVKDKTRVINKFDGLLCDRCLALNVTEAEALSETGWDLSPRAAHGLATGLVAATSAKDEEIMALRAALAQANAEVEANSDGNEQPPRRGPGRPPKSSE